MNEQLDLFEWATVHSTFTDLGGRCNWCLEHDNWLTKHHHSDVYDFFNTVICTITTVECQTPRYCLDTGVFIELCGNTKNIETAYEL